MAGKLSYSIALDLLKYIKQETDFIPIYSFVQILSALDKLAAGIDQYTSFKSSTLKALDVVYKKLTTSEIADDKHEDKLNRLNVLKWVCDLGNKDCTTKLSESFNPKVRVAPNMQAPVYCNALREDPYKNLMFILSLYNSDKTEDTEKRRIIAALGCITDENLLTQ